MAGAISLTTFMRRPEYAAATGAAVAKGAGDYGEGFAAAAPARRSPLALVEAIGRFVVHYPSYIVFVALANRMDLFLHAYLAMNAAYAARALLTIGRSLGTERSDKMKAIIVAAGRGRRLGQETEEIPKCMVEVAGRAILHRQLDALAAAGVDDVVIVRGYRGDKIAPPAGGPPLRFVENPDWAENNILTSLLYAEREMKDGFLFSYSDIVFAPEHARRLAEAPGPVALVIDRRWRDAYEGRTLHPVSEAELARVEGAGAAAARHARRQAVGRGRGGRRRVHRPGALLGRGGRGARRGLARGERGRPQGPLRRRRHAGSGLPQRRPQRARPRAAWRCGRSSSTGSGARSTPKKIWRGPRRRSGRGPDWT